MLFRHKFNLLSILCSVFGVKVLGNAGQLYVLDISVEILVYYRDIIVILT